MARNINIRPWRADWGLAGFFVVLLGMAMAAVSYEIELTYILILLFPFVFLAAFSFWRPRFGLIAALIYGFCLFTISRILPGLPSGIFFDLLVLAAFGGLLLRINRPGRRYSVGKRHWKHPLTIVLTIWLVYSFLQCFNPNNLSLEVALTASRFHIIIYLSFWLGYILLDDIRFIKRFTSVWLVLAMLAALYAFQQEYFGFREFEIKWLYSDPKIIELIFVNGLFRKWSFLANVSSFGMIMAYATLICVILLLGPISDRKKLVLGLSAVLFFIAMILSGTRTATIMLPVGLFLYTLMSLNSKKTLIISSLLSAVLVVILFGPFYTVKVMRLRSAFFFDRNQSLAVRNENRVAIQPYILTHPMGGGHLSTGARGIKHAPRHALAGFYPDNGYLETVLETGIPGLLIQFALYAVFMITGINAVFRCRDPVARSVLAAYVCAFFAASVAIFAQLSVFQKPMGFILICSFGIVLNLGRTYGSVKRTNHA